MSGKFVFAVALEAITADVARPTVFPICATVLKTPPANACVFSGKLAAMTRFATVNRTSAPTAFSAMPGKENAQYVACSFITARSRGLMPARTLPISTGLSALTLCAIRPMMMFDRVPKTGAGKK